MVYSFSIWTQRLVKNVLTITIANVLTVEVNLTLKIMTYLRNDPLQTRQPVLDKNTKIVPTLWATIKTAAICITAPAHRVDAVEKTHCQYSLLSLIIDSHYTDMRMLLANQPMCLIST